jgi:superfamily I DNA and/or RNA helicase
MALLHLESLPPRTKKGTIVRLLVQVGEIDRQRIGSIELRGRAATVEVPDNWSARLVKALDGALLIDQHVRAWSEAEAIVRGGEEDHFERLIRLLSVEAQAEAERTARSLRKLSAAEAEKAGNSLIGLTIQEEHAGLGGHVLVTLVKKSRERLPWTRLGVGSPVVVSEHDGDQRWRGVVSERTGAAIQVAMYEAISPSAGGETFRIDLSNDEVALGRQRAALQRVRGASGERLAELRRVLLGEVQPSFLRKAEPLTPLSESLNPSQVDAVTLALSADDLAMIHGPPGTGKTTTVVEVIRQAVRRGEKVLATAPSNLAVDNVFERLVAAGEKAVRLGHPARVLPGLREHTLDLMVDSHDDMRLARKLTREARALLDKAARYTRAKPAPGEKQAMREEAKRMLADARRLESQVVQQILRSADILCATLTGLDSEILGRMSFNMAVIDEACQTTEPACWIPLLRCDRVVLAGDHCQLPPTVISKEADAEGFGVSLFERLMAMYGEQHSRRLGVQYRMHKQIMDFSSAQFYESSLTADTSVAAHLLSDLAHVDDDSDLAATPVQFIDTAGAGYEEALEPDGESRLNEAEARLVARKVETLLAAGLPPRDIAVIAPYAAQVRLLRGLLLADGLEIDTVDGFQGREKEAVVISLVRSNGEGQIGFLSDVRRMNVALTRARRKLIVIGDSATIGPHPFYQQMLEYFETIGAYRTVWEEDFD